MTVMAPDVTTPSDSSSLRGASAALVALGILFSRIAGLVRERVFAHYLGNSPEAGAYKAGLRIPNVLQNLFGEGVLSASFIPVYARLLVERDEEMAGRLAGTIFSLLALIVTVIGVIGVWSTPWIVGLIAPGFRGDVRLLTIHVVQILFPATCLLVLSAWCLGVLNSHRRFFLPYVAPVFWNAAMITTLVLFGGHTTQPGLAIALSWGTVVGSALQFGIQVPFVLRYAPRLRPSLRMALQPVRQVIQSFGPVVLGRGVVQLSGYIDQLIASYLGTAAVAGLSYAQTIYLLPVSLFGMSIAAAELPQLSGTLGSVNEANAVIRRRLRGRLRQIAFFVVPSIVAFLFIGRPLVAALYQTGRFNADDTLYVWYVLSGSAVGLLAVALGRLYSSVFYALRDPKPPLRLAIIRVCLTAVLGLLFAFPLRPYIVAAIRVLQLPIPNLAEGEPLFGAIGLTASAGMAGWVEFLLLRRALTRRIGAVGLAPSFLLRLWVSGVVAGIIAVACNLSLTPYVLEHLPLPHISEALLVTGAFGGTYLGVAAALAVPEARTTVLRLTRL
jgi:putative peptidoglycan lipid II flippase